MHLFQTVFLLCLSITTVQSLNEYSQTPQYSSFIYILSFCFCTNHHYSDVATKKTFTGDVDNSIPSIQRFHGFNERGLFYQPSSIHLTAREAVKSPAKPASKGANKGSSFAATIERLF